MKKTNIYKYLGTNGVIESPIHLEDIYYIRLVELRADKGKVLTDGESTLFMIRVPENEVDRWKEIPEGQE
ncbi:MAG: hypothetical protein ACI4W0_05760 [Bacilli bacterium]